MNTDDLPVLDLPGGDPRARGQAHGELLRPRIAELLERWGDALEQIYGAQRELYVERLCTATHYAATTQRLAPSVLEEVSGIAEGAHCDYHSLWAFQHVNEEFEFAPRIAQTGPTGEGACSTVVLAPTAGRPAIVAQNLDLAEYLDGFQILLRCPTASGDGRIMALSVPGMLSLNGMNSHGFAVCDNTLEQLRGDPEGLPIYAIYRLLLESRTLEEALALIGRTPHAAGLNWVIGDPEGVAMVERSQSAMCTQRQLDDTPIYHTNHPLHCGEWAFSECAAGRRPRPYRSSYLRFAALHQRLHGTKAADLGVAELSQILASRDDPDYPLSRDGGQNGDDMAIGFTLACSIFELDREHPCWHLAAGPCHLAEMRTYGFDTPAKRPITPTVSEEHRLPA